MRRSSISKYMTELNNLAAYIELSRRRDTILSFYLQESYATAAHKLGHSEPAATQ
ncbi:Uncharacterised protein [Legionella sainthelensi]|nr:Uncharacterised protein [Legionella sainthelensi]